MLHLFLKLSFLCLLFLKVDGNKFDIKDLQTSQVFIYYRSITLAKFDLADCLGTLITTKFVLTGASCFINELSNIDVRDAIVVRVNFHSI